MQVFVAFLILCFGLGGTRIGRPFRDRQALFLALTFVVAASFYSLRVVL
jgi:hypothetical protein